MRLSFQSHSFPVRFSQEQASQSKGEPDPEALKDWADAFQRVANTHPDPAVRETALGQAEQTREQVAETQQRQNPPNQ